MVVIPTRNRADLVAGLVQRLLAFVDPPDEITVVDDGSSDDTAAKLGTMTGITVIDGTGDGPSAARNAGVQATSASWLIFLDDDDEPDDDWITAFRILVRAQPQARYLTVGSRRTDGVTTTPSAPQPMGPAFNDITASYLAGTFAIQRALYVEVGAFDSRLRHMEFTDLALRVFGRLAGQHEIAVDDTPRITHVSRPPALRESQTPHLLTSASTLVLDKTAHLWRRDPYRYADQLATVGVGFIRSSRNAEGVRTLLAAARQRPRSATHVGRALASLVPPIRRRLWPPFTAGPDQEASVTASVVITTDGRSDFLAEAVASGLHQTVTAVEVIVIDDGSSEPVAVVDDPRVRLIRQENSGAAIARNRGVAEATGDFVFFLNDDDVFSESRLDNALRAHLTSRADVVVCAQSWLEGGPALDRGLQGFIGDVVLDDITPHVGATSFRRGAFTEFEERYRVSEDVEWWLRLAQTRSVHSISDVDYLIRRHPTLRRSSGRAQRVECGIQLLHDHEAYFRSHKRARSFRLARLARSALAVGDSPLALKASAGAVRTRPTRHSIGSFVRASQEVLQETVNTDTTPTASTSVLATAHARSWVPRRIGPPESRLVARSRRMRLASTIAGTMQPPWAGYVRALGARLARKSKLDVTSAFGTFVVPRQDHTLLHPVCFEVFETAVMSRLITPGMTVIDIGANRGWYTSMAATLVGPAGSVVAVEPDPRMRKLLEVSIARNEWRDRVAVDARAICDDVVVHALTAVPGSLSRLGAPGTSLGKSAETTTLDRLLDEHGVGVPGLIKISVEGAEPRVLRSCDFERFGASLPIIMFEFQPDMIERAGENPTEPIKILRKAGYALLQLRPKHGDVVVLDDDAWITTSGDDGPAAGRSLLAVPADQVLDIARRLFIDGPSTN